MSLTLHAVFDGQVLKPEDAAGLQPNKRYLIRLEDPEEEPDPFALIAAMATDLGVSDLAEHHQEYSQRRCQNPEH